MAQQSAMVAKDVPRAAMAPATYRLIDRQRNSREVIRV
jgi:hypothetical protein